MTELYRQVTVTTGDGLIATMHYDYERDEQAEKDAKLGAAVRAWLDRFGHVLGLMCSMGDGEHACRDAAAELSLAIADALEKEATP